MEISSPWLIQDWVATVPAGTVFKNIDVANDLPTVGLLMIRQTLKEMRCVEIQTHGGTFSMVHNKLPSEQVCSDCPFEKSGSSGCVIARADIRRVFESRRNKLLMG